MRQFDVLWILQILFMMLGCSGRFESGGDESLCLVTSFAGGNQKKVSCRE